MNLLIAVVFTVAVVGLIALITRGLAQKREGGPALTPSAVTGPGLTPLPAATQIIKTTRETVQMTISVDAPPDQKATLESELPPAITARLGAQIGETDALVSALEQMLRDRGVRVVGPGEGTELDLRFTFLGDPGSVPPSPPLDSSSSVTFALPEGVSKGHLDEIGPVLTETLKAHPEIRQRLAAGDHDGAGQLAASVIADALREHGIIGPDHPGTFGTTQISLRLR